MALIYRNNYIAASKTVFMIWTYVAHFAQSLRSELQYQNIISNPIRRSLFQLESVTM